MNAQRILDFWFDEATKPLWFVPDIEFDEILHVNFTEFWYAAAAGELFRWREGVYGRLAEVLILDQFSRHLFRNSPRAYAQDSMALALAQEAVRDEEFGFMLPEYKQFMLMPFLHSESRIIHERACRLFARHTSAYVLDIELKHKNVIDRFGRYPHRNITLGRKSTVEEIAFMKKYGRGF